MEEHAPFFFLEPLTALRVLSLGILEVVGFVRATRVVCDVPVGGGRM
jgi:hypothetical protein